MDEHLHHFWLNAFAAFVVRNTVEAGLNEPLANPEIAFHLPPSTREPLSKALYRQSRPLGTALPLPVAFFGFSYALGSKVQGSKGSSAP
jgi:hypothetical protein